MEKEEINKLITKIESQITATEASDYFICISKDNVNMILNILKEYRDGQPDR